MEKPKAQIDYKNPVITIRGLEKSFDNFEVLRGIDLDVYQGEKLPVGKKSYALSFILQDEEKTLTDKTIDAIIQKLIYNFGKEAGAEIRK